MSLLLFLGLRCTEKKVTKEPQSEVIAKAYQYRLTKKDLENDLGDFQSKEDSSAKAEQYIDQWVIEKIMLHQAHQHLTNEEKKAIQERTRNFENALLINQWEENLIYKRLDTSVSEKEILQYYNEHQQNFQLQGLLVKVMFLKLPHNAPNINKVKQWYLLRNTKDSIELDNYAKHYALNYYFDRNNWIFFDDLMDEVPLQITEQELRETPYKTVIEDASTYFFVHIFDRLERNTIAPVEVEKNKIKKIILTKRMHQLRKEIKKEIINKAYENNAIEK